MTVEYSARSHVGRVREHNEDNVFIDGVIMSPEVRDCPFSIDGSSLSSVVLAVCDGMGGEENGDIASLTAVRKLAEISGKLKASTSREMSGLVQEYVSKVSAEIREIAGDVRKRIGTTLAMVLVTASGGHCFNIGDSRIYCLKATKLAQVTDDHTLVAEKVKSGVITAEQAKQEKDRHKLTRCIGIGEQSAVQSYPPINGKCRLVICSDGLTDMVTDNEIEKALSQSERTLKAADALLDSALEHGGGDNVTVVVVDVVAPASFVSGITNKLRKWRKI